MSDGLTLLSIASVVSLLLAMVICAFGAVTVWDTDGKLFKTMVSLVVAGVFMGVGAVTVKHSRKSTVISPETETIRFQPTNNVTMLVTNVRTMTAPELAADHMVLAKDAIHRTIEETLVEVMKSGWRAGEAGISQAEMLHQFTNRVVRVLP